jgi:hypothetical protein
MLKVHANGYFMQKADLTGTDGIRNVEPLICASGKQQFIAFFWSGRPCMRYAYFLKY